MFRKIGFALVTLALATAALPRKADADCGGAVIIGGLLGLFVGSAMQAHADCNRQACCDQQGYRNHMIREVLQNYDPRRHCEFVEYVSIDLEGWITAQQQRQLLDLLQQRRMCFLQDNYCAVR